MKLGVLEFGYLRTNSQGMVEKHSHEVINELFDFAQELDKMGYSRIWLAEHNSDGPAEYAWASTDILIQAIAGITENIIVGSGGCLPKYNIPLRVAHTYKMLNALYAGRIDLGIAKAGTYPAELQQELMNMEVSEDRFFSNLDKLMFYLGIIQEPLYPQYPIQPIGSGNPNVWFLGAGTDKLKLIAKYKGNLCISLFHHIDAINKYKDIFHLYRQVFYDENGYLPECSIAVQFFCDKDPDKVKAKHERAYIQSVGASSGLLGVQKKALDTLVSGSPKACYEKLQELADIFDVNEVILHSTETDYHQKVKMFRDIQKETKPLSVVE
jgi:alkanesulfonate monooxygenase SsuD/methylene tetrahydromethanopterin reductase-like flavin-dependent oxidoreductase (luciferase family)